MYDLSSLFISLEPLFNYREGFLCKSMRIYRKASPEQAIYLLHCWLDSICWCNSHLKDKMAEQRKPLTVLLPTHERPPSRIQSAPASGKGQKTLPESTSQWVLRICSARSRLHDLGAAAWLSMTVSTCVKMAVWTHTGSERYSARGRRLPTHTLDLQAFFHAPFSLPRMCAEALSANAYSSALSKPDLSASCQPQPQEHPFWCHLPGLSCLAASHVTCAAGFNSKTTRFSAIPSCVLLPNRRSCSLQ